MTYHPAAALSGSNVVNDATGGDNRGKDAAEAWVNAIAGLGISLALVAFLRAVGAWDAPAWAVAAVFFLASVARSYALRRLFRWLA